MTAVLDKVVLVRNCLDNREIAHASGRVESFHSNAVALLDAFSVLCLYAFSYLCTELFSKPSTDHDERHHKRNLFPREGGIKTVLDGS